MQSLFDDDMAQGKKSLLVVVARMEQILTLGEQRLEALRSEESISNTIGASGENRRTACT